MGRVAASRAFPGPVSEAEELWYDTTRWPVWMDGVANVAKIEGDWPHDGATVIWDSPPAGRGRVRETVARYEVRVGQTLSVEDERMRGTQSVKFDPLEDGVKVTLALDYTLKESRGPFAVLTDLFFIRRQFGDSLRRSLIRFGRELQADRELL
jgi:polyketide cyclase/dehydrase/lipid transport protein